MHITQQIPHHMDVCTYTAHGRGSCTVVARQHPVLSEMKAGQMAPLGAPFSTACLPCLYQLLRLLGGPMPSHSCNPSQPTLTLPPAPGAAPANATHLLAQCRRRPRLSGSTPMTSVTSTCGRSCSASCPLPCWGSCPADTACRSVHRCLGGGLHRWRGHRLGWALGFGWGMEAGESVVPNEAGCGCS